MLIDFCRLPRTSVRSREDDPERDEENRDKKKKSQYV